MDEMPATPGAALSPRVPEPIRFWVPIGTAFAVYSAVTVVITYPLVLHLSTKLPKDLGDPLLVTAILWWNAHAVPLTERWWNGFGFFPATGMMAFSEHFLGASIIASPLQWLGASPVTAYNIALLVSFPLCGIAAHGLAYALTRRHDAAMLCGLAYAFNPARIAHLEHLELLMAFGMPVALAALHLYLNTGRARWVAVFAAALIAQVLSASYYALFFTVFFALWVLWFIRPAEWRRMVAILAAATAAVVAVSPLILGYERIHDRYSLTRDFTEEVLRFSADVSSFVTASPLSALWGWTAGLNGGERQLFPGLTIVCLTGAAVLLLRRSAHHERAGWRRLAALFWAMSAVFAGVALSAVAVGPWQANWGWLRVSVSDTYKPTSVALAFAVLAASLSPSFRHAYTRRSSLGFYLLAAVMLFFFSLGPRPAFLGEQVLYEPPYAWLMRLPLFGDTARVPARFGMLAILALSVAAGLAFHRLTAGRQYRAAVFACAALGILADGWVRPLPLPEVPQGSFEIPPSDQSTAILELPIGDVWRDSAALYRVTIHERPTVNGYNGFEPAYYQVLRRAFDENDATILDALATHGPLLIAADKTATEQNTWATLLSNRSGIRRLSDDAHWALFQLAQAPPRALPPACDGDPLAIAALFDRSGSADLRMVTDGRLDTHWITDGGQRVGEALVLDLGRPETVCEVVLSMGSSAAMYPGALSVATSPDRQTWTRVFSGPLGGAAFRAALADARDSRIAIPVAGPETRFIRLQLERAQPDVPWSVAELAVVSTARSQRAFAQP